MPKGRSGRRGLFIPVSHIKAADSEQRLIAFWFLAHECNVGIIKIIIDPRRNKHGDYHGIDDDR